MNQFLKNGLWEEWGFGWGRVRAEENDWNAKICRAFYELSNSLIFSQPSRKA